MDPKVGMKELGVSDDLGVKFFVRVHTRHLASKARTHAPPRGSGAEMGRRGELGTTRIGDDIKNQRQQ